MQRGRALVRLGRGVIALFEADGSAPHVLVVAPYGDLQHLFAVALLASS